MKGFPNPSDEEVLKFDRSLPAIDAKAIVGQAFRLLDRTHCRTQPPNHNNVVLHLGLFLEIWSTIQSCHISNDSAPPVKTLGVSFFFLLFSNETGLLYCCTALTAFHCTDPSSGAHIQLVRKDLVGIA